MKKFLEWLGTLDPPEIILVIVLIIGSVTMILLQIFLGLFK
jgi:hypothetical protein